MSGVLKKIFSAGAKELTESVGNILDNLTTSGEEVQEAKTKITDKVNDTLYKVMDLQAEVMKTEMTGNWLQRSWRPLVMLAFAAVVVIGAFYPIPYIETDHQFWNLLELGLGGYVVGRSVEKVADSVTKNIDLGSLRKKDRKDLYQ